MSEAVYFGAAARPARATAARKGRKAPLVVLTALALGAVGFFSLVAPSFAVGRWEVNSSGAIPASEVLAWAGVKGGESFFGVDAEALRRRIAAHPGVLRVEVRKAFPDAVSINIVPRTPAALIMADSEAGTRLVAVDAEGVLMREGGPAEAAALPIVSGLELPRFDYGARMPASFRPFLASLAQVRSRDPALLEPFSEIRVARRAGGDFDLVLYPVAAPVRILAPAVLNEGLLQDIMLALGMVAAWEGGPAVESIDFRSSTVTFKSRKEAGLGR